MGDFNPKINQFEKQTSENNIVERDLSWLHENLNNQPIYTPHYGDVTELNTERTIIDLVGKETIAFIVSDLMDLLETSVAVYEKNGDYAFGMFNSGWCQLMDSASRKLCNTDDNKIALSCGKWHCHDDCWNNSAKAAITSKKTTDIDCIGGIKLFAEPIFVNNQVVGTINIGYGNPPKETATLQKLAHDYNIDFELLKAKSYEYNPRPNFIIEIAKKRLLSVAKLIGEIITRKQAEQQLIDSKAKFEALFENSPLPTYLWKQENNELVLYNFNLASVRFTQKKISDIKGITLSQMYGDNQQIFDDFNQCFKQKTTIEREINYRFKTTGEKKYLNVKYTYVKPDFVMVITQDITDQKLAEQTLKKGNERYQKAQQLGKVGNWEYNIQTTEFWGSEQAKIIYGFNPNSEVFSVHEVESCITERERVHRALLDLIEENKPYNLEFDIITHNTQERKTITSIARLEHDENGNPLKVTGVIHDITDRKLAEQALKISEENYRSLF
ncbi:MAG: PocR ligand-binding domain-containing protein [Bacteroidales bacterium]|nr:PocR ligand-binding domain-containing protein [Bacteroidales bacterium]